MEQKTSRQGILFSQYVKRVGRIQRKLRQIEGKTHRDDLYKLTKKQGSMEESNQMSKKEECRGSYLIDISAVKNYV